jgi:hypothetical protein
MIVTLFDRQDERNPLNGSSHTRPSLLLDCLRLLSSRPPFFCEIEGENGFKLLVGVGGNWSCIQHSSVDRAPPYLMAVPKELQLGAQSMEFLMGNTPTPVHHRYILRAGFAEKVISFFVETGQKSESVEWAEI